MRIHASATLTILMITALCQAQTTRPTTARGPATARATSRPAAARVPAPMPTDKTDVAARAFLDRGVKELDGNQNEAALKSLLSGLEYYGVGDSAPSNDSPTRSALHHAVAVAQLRLNQTASAKTSIERAHGSKWTNDSLTFNLATVWIVTKINVSRAVNLLDKYLADHPDADESWVNLFGLSLQKAAPDLESKKKYEENFKHLEAYQTRLEATRPGKHRWGSSWIDEKEWKDIDTKVHAANQKIEQLQARVEQAQKQLQQVSQQTSSAARSSGSSSGSGGGRRSRGGGSSAPPPPTPSAAGTSQDPVTRARQQLMQAQKALAQADKGPQPTWDIQLAGITPDINMVSE